MFYLKRLLILFVCLSLVIGSLSCSNDEDGTVDTLSEASTESVGAPSITSTDESQVDFESSESESEESGLELSSSDNSTNESSDNITVPSIPTTPYVPVVYQDARSESDSSFHYFSPRTQYVQTWEKNGMALHNTEFVMSESLASKLSYLNSFGKAQSVMLIELETNMAFTFEADTKVATASAIKAPMALYVSKCIDAGHISWDTLKSYQVRHFQANSTGTVQNYAYGTSFSVETLMDYMIRISDNQAYLMLKELVGASNFNKMMIELGGTQVIPDGSNWGYITAYEMAMAWREIYYYSNFNENGVSLFDRFMHARYNYIWYAIPQYEAAHKSGWSGKAFNDAGVVFADGHQYVLVVLCGRNGLDDDSSQYHFTYVTQMLAELMVEYNTYLEQGINPGA